MRTYVPTAEWIMLDWHHACVVAEVLCVQRCTSCGRWRHPPRRFCPSCLSDRATFEPVVGDGSVSSFVVSHRSLDPGWHAQAPYATLVVELDEGPRVLAATTIPPADIRIGQRVAVRIDATSDSFVLVWAEPRPASDDIINAINERRPHE